MTSNISCGKNHQFTMQRVEWNQISYSQANQWRHKCAACAYELGYKDAMAEAARTLGRMFTREVQDLLPPAES